MRQHLSQTLEIIALYLTAWGDVLVVCNHAAVIAEICVGAHETELTCLNATSALPVSCWGAAAASATAPAALTPLAGCRAGPVGDMALDPSDY